MPVQPTHLRDFSLQGVSSIKVLLETEVPLLLKLELRSEQVSLLQKALV